MYVGLTSTLRDPIQAPAAPVQPQPQRAPAPEPAADAFGPATRVDVSADKPAPVRNREPVEHTVDVDTATRTVIYRSKDPNTGTVVFQVPDESKLRLRQYLDEMAQHQAAAATAGTHPNPSTIDSIRV